MQITKKINNNVALGLDSNDEEIIVFGTGIGFPAVPYELKDLSKISKTFYHIDATYLGLLKDIPEKIFMLAAEIVEYARSQIKSELNPNLPFTLADHINFAIERYQKDIDILNPFMQDIKYLYPKEIQIGRQAVDLISKRIQIQFSDHEAANIALHIINSEGGLDDMTETIRITKLLKQITKIIEVDHKFKIDHDSLDFSRFVIHIRYLLRRRMQTPIIGDVNSKMMFDSLVAEYPHTYECFREINAYLSDALDWKYHEEEQLYLLIHLNRLCSMK